MLTPTCSDAGGGPGAWSAEAMERRLAGTRPVLRDTTMLFRYQATAAASEPSGWRAWRLRVRDPGVWMIHCHWLQHMLMGMSTVWVFGDAADLLALPPPDVAGYLVYGGDVYGNATHDPAVVHFGGVAAAGGAAGGGEGGGERSSVGSVGRGARPFAA